MTYRILSCIIPFKLYKFTFAFFTFICFNNIINRLVILVNLLYIYYRNTTQEGSYLFNIEWALSTLISFHLRHSQLHYIIHTLKMLFISKTLHNFLAFLVFNSIHFYNLYAPNAYHYFYKWEIFHLYIQKSLL